MNKIGKNKLTIITGATSGIGLALAKQLYKSHSLVLIGRRPKEDLQQVLPLEILENNIYIQTDISNIDISIDEVLQQLIDLEIHQIDHIVHCAGTGFYKSPEAEEQDEIEQTVSVNLLFPIALTHALTGELASANGKVTFIGSVAHKGSANMASYASTKAGLHGFARSLRSEWDGKIGVQIFHPGPTLTPMLEKAGYKIGFEKIMFLKPEAMAKEIASFMQTNKFSKTAFLGAKLKHLFLGLKP